MIQPGGSPRVALLDALSQIARSSCDPAQKTSAAVVELHRYLVAVAGLHDGKPCFSARVSAHLFSLAHELRARALGASGDYESLYLTVERLACELAGAEPSGTVH
jgi:hypothetical protein